MFWNLHGFKTLTELTQGEQSRLLQFDIIMFAETFVTGPMFPTPNFLKAFEGISSPATKNKQKGRASGGIVILCNKDIFSDSEPIDVCPWWVFAKLKIRSTQCEIVVGMCYVNQNSSAFRSFCDQLDILLHKLNQKYLNLPIWICGDFNSKVGENGAIFDNRSLSTLAQDRTSTDERSDGRGMNLLEVMENSAYGLINGRTISDRPAKCTFIAEQGKSVIDLCFVNLLASLETTDSKVLNFSGSDHVPYAVETKLAASAPNEHNLHVTSPPIEEKMIWDPEKKDKYQESITNCVRSEPISDIEDYVAKIKSTADSLDMVKKFKPMLKNSNSQAWFDKTCKQLKRSARLALKECKRNGYGSQYMEHYLIIKKKMKQYFKARKVGYWKAKKERLAAVNTTEFWKEIASIAYKPGNRNLIKKEEWTNFYESILPTRTEEDFSGQDAAHPTLDSPILKFELEFAIKSLKLKKAPGPEGLTNEFLKALPEEGKEELLQLFNQILESETIPSEWSQATITNLYKSGSAEDPRNYRPIALLNNSMKLFTRILLHRLSLWAERCKVLPESQAGFRKGRDCMEQIFNLQTAITLNLMRGKKIYGAFVDFERAFPSIKHFKLFLKLQDAGVSSKFIRILEGIYKNAKMRIKTAFGLTDSIHVTEGVLQGEQLSPIIFSLFIADMEQFFIDRGCKGIKLNDLVEILVLFYADDLILLGESPEDLNRKLGILQQYCEENGLKVNIKKTKVIIFRKGGRLPGDQFYYNNEKLEVVSTYVYLGICFSSSGLFRKAADDRCSKARQKSGVIRSLLAKGRSDSWETVTKLFDSCILPTLLYASPVWGLRYLDQLEKIQTKFIKDVLLLPRNSPAYMVRYETGRTKVEVELVRRVLRFWGKILRTDNSRLLKQCYLELLEPQYMDSRHTKYNWALQLKNLLISNGFVEVWERQSHEFLGEHVEDIVEAMRTKYREQDTVRVQQSTFNTNYSDIKSYPEPASYLLLPSSMVKKRLIARFRIFSSKYSKFSVYTSQGTHTFQSDDDAICQLCNLKEPESSTHFLYRCQLYSPYRDRYLQQNSSILPNPINATELDNFFYYISASLKLRAWTLEE